ncbi:MAG: hypothetical protein EZS26_001085 [Candidatus Ordinivivax streblomastigis]|uniref:Uncharacterized protein n=1 Tax=Candidatus Ordinivivax streblomastigis TaxID=2540710 RepID=A0A5M8P2H0_9BACT|nr:MAG: hypothetical protein EZS26_001085 [Candidatus Ordinivivax streblomastigis]
MKRMKFSYILLFIEIWIILPVEAQPFQLDITAEAYSIFNPWFGVGSSLRRAKSKALALQNNK